LKILRQKALLAIARLAITLTRPRLIKLQAVPVMKSAQEQHYHSLQPALHLGLIRLAD
jgi:hypothetical protein